MRNPSNQKAMLVLRVDELERATEALRSGGVPVVSSGDLYALFDAP